MVYNSVDMRNIGRCYNKIKALQDSIKDLCEYVEKIQLVDRSKSDEILMSFGSPDEGMFMKQPTPVIFGNMPLGGGLVSISGMPTGSLPGFVWQSDTDDNSFFETIISHSDAIIIADVLIKSNKRRIADMVKHLKVKYKIVYTP